MFSSKLKIFAHRGLWKNRKEKNSIEAIERAFLNGFDVETDLRIVNGEFIISHDLPKINDYCLHLELLLKILKKYPKRTIALHFKYDDWRKPEALNIIKYLKPYKRQVFLFDMSINFCELLKKTASSILVGVSVGDKNYHAGFAEIGDALNANIDFIWADEYRKFYDLNLFNKIKQNNKKVFCISPDLAQGVGHPKAVVGFEKYILNLIKWGVNGLCTDKPKEVRKIYADYCTSGR